MQLEKFENLFADKGKGEHALQKKLEILNSDYLINQQENCELQEKK